MDDLWDEHEVVALVTQVTNDAPFTQRDTEYEQMRDLLFQRRFVSIPGVTVDPNGQPKTGMLQFRSPEIEDHAHAFKNRMLAAPASVKVAAKSKAEKAVASAQRQQNFFKRHYERWRDAGVFDGTLFDQAAVGIGWTSLSLNTELLPIVPDPSTVDDPAKYFELAEDELREFASGEEKDLFVLEHIDANTMYWSPGHDILIQKAMVPLNPLTQQYGSRGMQIDYSDKTGLASVTTLDPGQNALVNRNNWARQVTLYTVSTEDYCYHVMLGNPSNSDSGSVLGVYKNYFGRPTFFPCIGEKTGDAHPLYAYRSLLNGKYRTVPIKNVLTTAMTTAGSEASQQRYALKWVGQGQPPEDDYNVQVTITSDGIVVPPAGYELVNSGLQVGPDLPAALAHIEKIDSYGYPSALKQPQEVSASSGYDRARQQDSVSSLLDPPLAHFANMLGDIFRAMLHAVSEIDLPITVSSVESRSSMQGGPINVQNRATIEPDDARTDTDIAVNFDSVTVYTRVAMQEEGMKLMQADQMTETDFQLDVMGTDDMEEFRDQRALDKVIKKADDAAVAAVEQVIQKIADATAAAAIAKNNVPMPAPPPQSPADAMVPTNGDMLRSDRGPSIPTGLAGGAMPVTPTAPTPDTQQGMTM